MVWDLHIMSYTIIILNCNENDNNLRQDYDMWFLKMK